MDLLPLQLTIKLEEKLTAINYRHPKGDKAVFIENNEKFRAAFLEFLIDKETAKTIPKESRRQCSKNCL